MVQCIFAEQALTEANASVSDYSSSHAEQYLAIIFNGAERRAELATALPKRSVGVFRSLDAESISC